MSLSSLLASARAERGGLVLEVPDAWLQGRSVFGGLQVALALRAMRNLVPQVPLRTLQATLIAPVAGTLEAHAEVLRTGKNATHASARIVHGGKTAAVFVGVFGEARESAVRVTPVRRDVVGGEPQILPFIPGVMPNFTQHFAVRLLAGSPPFTGKPVTECVYEVSVRDEGPTNEAHVVAVADYVPPVGLSHLARPAPGSTLTWMLEPLRDHFEDLPLAGFRVDSQLVAASDGYTNQSVMIWAPDGSPVAISHQSMLVFG